MRDEPLSNCEREFILNAIAENVRLDGRKCDEFRDLKVIVGADYGVCLVMAGNTKVLAKVSCGIVEPKSAHGNMGMVEVHVDMSPMGASTHEDGRLGARGIELTRLLELICRDSGAIDLEALCLTAYKKVWQIRLDVHILQVDGSLIDCASVAAITALAHFRRPDVSVLTDAILVHSSDKKAPIPLTIYHMPIYVSCGISPDGQQQVVVDALEREEICLKGALVVAANKRHEICALHQMGNLLLSEDLIVRCVDVAIQRAIDVTELISTVLTDDNNKRLKGDRSLVGFAGLISMDMLTSHHCEPNELIAPRVDPTTIHINDQQQQQSITITERGTVHIGEPDSPLLGDSVVTENELLEQVEQIAANAQIQQQQQSSNAKQTDTSEPVDSDQRLLDSIEEELAMLLPEDTNVTPPPPVQMSTSSPSQRQPVVIPFDSSSNAPVELRAAVKRKKK